MIRLFLRAVKAWIKFWHSGCERVSRPARKTRLKICDACSFRLTHRFLPTKCCVCGCFIALKSWCATEDCPRGYWKK